ncbi:NEQ291 [Nanoarchaeum equitans Kin4-M]|uniref:NEQ291 n=1 Tax=Nanoarchaeum equitans (strain Kin4-M) TaxID=228908 RepID=Q74NH4_NANEQ|nr:NEQ291 [Nanoarchaeum equitans Kin4-M]
MIPPLDSIIINVPKDANGQNIKIALITTGFNHSLYEKLKSQYNLNDENIRLFYCLGSDKVDINNWGTYSAAIIKSIAPNVSLDIYDCDYSNKMLDVTKLNLSKYDLVVVTLNYNTPFDDCSDKICKFLSKFPTIASAGFAIHGTPGKGYSNIKINVDTAKYGTDVALYNATIQIVSAKDVSVLFPTNCCYSIESPKEKAITCRIQSMYIDEPCYYDGKKKTINLTINTNYAWKLKIIEHQSPTYSDVLYLDNEDYNYTLQSPCFAKICVVGLDGYKVLTAQGPTLLGQNPTLSAQSKFDFGFYPGYAAAVTAGAIALLMQYFNLTLDEINIDWIVNPKKPAYLYGKGILYLDFNKLLKPKIDVSIEKCYQSNCKIKVESDIPLKVCVEDDCKFVNKSYEFNLQFPFYGNTTIDVKAYIGNKLVYKYSKEVYVEKDPLNIKAVYVDPDNIRKGEKTNIFIIGQGKNIDIYIDGIYYRTIDLNGSYSIEYTPTKTPIEIKIRKDNFEKTFSIPIIFVNKPKDLNGSLYLAIPYGDCNQFMFNQTFYCDGDNLYKLIPIDSQLLSYVNDTIKVFVYKGINEYGIKELQIQSNNYTTILPFGEYKDGKLCVENYCFRFNYLPQKVITKIENNTLQIITNQPYPIEIKINNETYIVKGNSTIKFTPRIGLNLIEIKYKDGHKVIPYYYYEKPRIEYKFDGHYLYLKASHKDTIFVIVNNKKLKVNVSKEWSKIDVSPYLIKGLNIIHILGYYKHTILYDGKQIRYFDYYQYDVPAIELKLNGKIKGKIKVIPTYLVNFNYTIKGNKVTIKSDPFFAKVYHNGKLIYVGIIENNTFPIPVKIENGDVLITIPGKIEYKNISIKYGVFYNKSLLGEKLLENYLNGLGIYNKLYYEKPYLYKVKWLCYGETNNIACNINPLQYKKFDPIPKKDQVPFGNYSIKLIRKVNLIVTACKSVCTSIKREINLDIPTMYSFNLDKGWYMGKPNIRIDDNLYIDTNNDFKPDITLREGESRIINNKIFYFNKTLYIGIKTKPGFYIVNDSIVVGEYKFVIPTFFTAIYNKGYIKKYFTKRDIIYLDRPIYIKPQSWTLDIKKANNTIIGNTDNYITVYNKDIYFKIKGQFKLHLDGFSYIEEANSKIFPFYIIGNKLYLSKGRYEVYANNQYVGEFNINYPIPIGNTSNVYKIIDLDSDAILYFYNNSYIFLPKDVFIAFDLENNISIPMLAKCDNNYIPIYIKPQKLNCSKLDTPLFTWDKTLKSKIKPIFNTRFAYIFYAANKKPYIEVEGVKIYINNGLTIEGGIIVNDNKTYIGKAQIKEGHVMVIKNNKLVFETFLPYTRIQKTEIEQSKNEKPKAKPIKKTKREFNSFAIIIIGTALFLILIAWLRRKKKQQYPYKEI